jgi:hypothetical protein
MLFPVKAIYDDGHGQGPALFSKRRSASRRRYTTTVIGNAP